MRIPRKTFVFTLGYSGKKAVAIKKSIRSYGKLNCRQLLEKGFYKAAFSLALYKNDLEGMEEVRKHYNSQSQIQYQTMEEMKMLFGVNAVPAEVAGIIEV